VVSGAPKRKRDEDDTRFSNESPKKRMKVDHDEETKADDKRVKLVLMLQGVPGLGKTALVPIIRERLQQWFVSTSHNQDEIMPLKTQSQGNRESKELFEEKLKNPNTNIIILDRQNWDVNDYVDYTTLAKKYRFKIVSFFPEELLNEQSNHLTPSCLQSVMKRSRHPTFDLKTLDEQFHLTLMYISALKPARLKYVDKRFNLSWLHPRKCKPLKSDRVQFLGDIMSHSTSAGWRGSAVSADLIVSRLGFHSTDYSKFRRTKESIASQIVDKLTPFVNEHWPKTIPVKKVTEQTPTGFYNIRKKPPQPKVHPKPPPTVMMGTNQTRSVSQSFMPISAPNAMSMPQPVSMPMTNHMQPPPPARFPPPPPQNFNFQANSFAAAQTAILPPQNFNLQQVAGARQYPPPPLQNSFPPIPPVTAHNNRTLNNRGGANVMVQYPPPSGYLPADF